MPIATPPPDFDPTMVPPVRRQPSESEARETGVASEPAAKPDPHLIRDKHITDLVKLWPQDRGAASLLLAWQFAD